LHRRYLERKERRGTLAGGPVTAFRLEQEGFEIQQSRVLDDTFAHMVLVSGLLPLFQLPEAESLPMYTELLRLVGGRIPEPVPALPKEHVDEVPRVRRFLKDCQLYAASKRTHKEKFPWLPIGIDGAELIPHDFSEEDWHDAVQSGMTEFVRFNVLSMVGPRYARDVPVNVPLEFVSFAIFDGEWGREIWELVRGDFGSYV
ncbi:hypothetical protein V1517DRAFT_248304, partial [Lipomyces orientalis]